MLRILRIPSPGHSGAYPKNMYMCFLYFRYKKSHFLKKEKCPTATSSLFVNFFRLSLEKIELFFNDISCFISKCLYVYICVYMCIYVDMYIYLCIYICIFVSVHMYRCIYVFMYACNYVYMYIHLYKYVYIYIYITYPEDTLARPLGSVFCQDLGVDLGVGVGVRVGVSASALRLTGWLDAVWLAGWLADSVRFSFTSLVCSRLASRLRQARLSGWLTCRFAACLAGWLAG